MPWLIKDAEKPEDNLFFIHVPRCGGTSLMKNHNVPTKSLEGRSFLSKIAMKVFFIRYELLEKANFPIWSRGNAICLLFMGLGYFLATHNCYYFGICDMVFFGALMLGLTFVFVAPTIARIRVIRRMFLVFQKGGLMESIDWCTGTNIHGYINHLTAHKVLDYGYVSADVWNEISTMAIVRNPYSRMVSIYMYNRWGLQEKFTDFVQRWYDMLHDYRTNSELEEWYTCCHGFAQYEFTHFNGQQLVQSIVKQEELKLLTENKNISLAIQQDSSVKNLPNVVRESLLGMPHSNQRKRSQPWYMYYDQHSMDLTYQLNALDFTIFNYDADDILKKRPDDGLLSPTRLNKAKKPVPPPKQLSRMSRNSKSTSSRFLQDVQDAAAASSFNELGNELGNLSFNGMSNQRNNDPLGKSFSDSYVILGGSRRGFARQKRASMVSSMKDLRIVEESFGTSASDDNEGKKDK